DVPTLLFARTDALAAALLTSDVDEYDRDFVTGERTSEGFYRVREGLDQAISRALAYAPYADVLWCETSTPNRSPASSAGSPRWATASSASRSPASTPSMRVCSSLPGDTRPTT